MFRVRRQQAPRRVQRPVPHARQRAERDGRERRTKRRCPHLGNFAASELGERGKAVDVAGLALVVRHPQQRVALQVLDRGVIFARRQRDVSDSDIVLEVDPLPRVRQRQEPERARRLPASFPRARAERRCRRGDPAPPRRQRPR